MRPALGLLSALSMMLQGSSCAGGDRSALPPGQAWTDRFPVYSYAGDVSIPLEEWRLGISGLASVDTVLDWNGFLALGAVSDTLDFHCVTGWSRRGDIWTGIPSRAILDLARPLPGAVSVMVHCADGYTTNVPLVEFDRDGVMLAFELDGEALAPEHGFPVRLIVPQLYAYKAAKWVTGLEFMAENLPGYWESRGYHTRGDPWLEERYGNP